MSGLLLSLEGIVSAPVPLNVPHAAYICCPSCSYTVVSGVCEICQSPLVAQVCLVWQITFYAVS